MPSPTRWLPGALGAALLAGTLAAPAAAQQARDLGVDTANFDRSVRPQDDFYRFVNGTWIKDTKIPSDKSSYGTFIELRDKSDNALRAIIDEAAAQPNPPRGSEVQKTADFYRSYMDTAQIQRLGVQPLRPDLNRIAGLRSKAALPSMFADLQRIGVQTPFGMYVGQDAKQADRYTAYISQSGLGLPDRDYYFKEGAKFDSTRTAYLGYISTLLRLAGDPNPAGAAKRIMALETQLAEHHWDRAKNRDRDLTYNPKTLAELQKMAPGFDWAEFAKAAGVVGAPSFVVRQPDYLPAMNAVLERTPLATWQEYERFKLLDAYADELSKPFVDAKFAFRGKTLRGQEENEPRWKRAVGATEGALGEAVGKLYVERNFKPESKARMEELVNNLKQAYAEAIQQADWMSPETKKEGLAKLAKFNTKIAYPDKWKDYSALEIRPGDVVGNEMRANRWGYNEMVDRLGKPIDRTEWGMTPQTVNAYYSSTMNEIVFPAAILQAPFFDPKADDATNYGAIGAVIGHEIGHGFDDQGRKSDGSGNLRDWWTPADAKAYQGRADRLAQQYDAYEPVPGQHINGKLTLGENLGDLNGVAIAHRAYELSLNGKPAPVIDGFTGDQRFFLGWAQVWRSLNRDAALRQQLLTDPHSPGEYRVNGVLRNVPAFYKAFNVKPGDKMYLPPEERVSVW